jgi:hypothetical protein
MLSSEPLSSKDLESAFQALEGASRIIEELKGFFHQWSYIGRCIAYTLDGHYKRHAPVRGRVWRELASYSKEYGPNSNIYPANLFESSVYSSFNDFYFLYNKKKKKKKLKQNKNKKIKWPEKGANKIVFGDCSVSGTSSSSSWDISSDDDIMREILQKYSVQKTQSTQNVLGQHPYDVEVYGAFEDEDPYGFSSPRSRYSDDYF